jgi:site-specific DNA recombinase
VVYKVDRLTRSLADFAKLVELFDQHSVSFVSVTQSFNTTSSMGRLTLNVLLSFAQFEREVIGERVRDKIAASKRKGIWVGGPVPLGYASVNKKLVVVPEEAKTVGLICGRYLELGSIPSCRTSTAEASAPSAKSAALVRPVAGYPLESAPLLTSCTIASTLGKWCGKAHRGEHKPIVDQAVFEAVQTRLAAAPRLDNCVSRVRRHSLRAAFSTTAVTA